MNLIEVQGYDAAAAGLAQLPLMAMVILLSGWSGAFCDRKGARRLLLVGLLLASLGFLGLSLAGITKGERDYWVTFFPPVSLLGTAMGLTIAPLSTTLMSAIPSGRAGLAAGINSTASRLSSVLGIALLGPLAMITLREAIAGNPTASFLDGAQRQALMHRASHLAPSAILADQSIEAIRAHQEVLTRAYVDAFAAVSYACAAATLCAAIIVFRSIPPFAATRESAA